MKRWNGASSGGWRGMKRILAAAVMICALTAAPGVRAQAPVFDIVTIKPHAPGDGNVSVRARPGNYEATNLALKRLIADAYGVRDFLISGLPSWAESARYDIQAKVSEPDVPALQKMTREERKGMMVALLKERFGLVAHNETKVQSLYELTVAPEGLKLKESPVPPVVDGEAPKKPRSEWSTTNGHYSVKASPMIALADALAGEVERFVADKTGLTESYDFELAWTPEENAGKEIDNGAKTDAAPNLFTALKEQLGLQLKAGKGPVPTLVIDRIEPPQAN